MKLLLLSDGAATGFGRVGREMSRRFMAAGVDIRWIAVNWRGREGEQVAFSRRDSRPQAMAQFLTDFDADPVHQVMVPAAAFGDAMGTNLIAPAVEGKLWGDWKPDRVLIVADPRAMTNRLAALKGLSVPIYNYVPIEGRNLTPAWRSLWADLIPVAMSDFGRHQLEVLLQRPVVSVPHGVSEAFRPLTPANPSIVDGRKIGSKADAKSTLAADGRIVILRTDRLVPRKNYPALFRTIAPVLERHPEALLVIHCAPLDEGGVMAEFVAQVPGSFDVAEQWRHPQIRFTGAHDTFQGYPDEKLNILYNAADIYASPTQAEGFGLTLAEAAACGVPVVTTDYAAGPEVVGPGGVLVPPVAFQTNDAALDWALVDEARFSAEVEALLTDPAKREAIGRAGAAHVRQFTWDRAASEFLTVMG